MTRFTIGIVNYNTRELLLRCMEAALSEDPAELIVIDSGSSDGSVEMARSRFPRARVIAGANTGFGGGCNRLIELCQTEYLLILNSDAILRPGALRILGRELDEHPDSAMAAPRLFSADGTVQRSWRRFPGSFPWLFDNGVLRKLIRLTATNEVDAARSRPVPWVFGAAFAARVAAIRQVNGFDPDFFMYCEDIDLCYRLKRAGWEVRYAPAAGALHVGGASTGQVHAAMAEQLIQSTVLFYRKHYSGVRVWLLIALLKTTLAVRWLRDSLLSLAAREEASRLRLSRNASVWRAAMKLRAHARLNVAGGN